MKRFFNLWIISIVLIMGLTFIACKMDDNENGTEPKEKSQLTINNLPDPNVSYSVVILNEELTPLNHMSNWTYDEGLIDSLVAQGGSTSTTLVDYKNLTSKFEDTGNYSVLLKTWNNRVANNQEYTEYLPSGYINNVSFSNGYATISWNDFVFRDIITVKDLTADIYGNFGSDLIVPYGLYTGLTDATCDNPGSSISDWNMTMTWWPNYNDSGDIVAATIQSNNNPDSGNYAFLLEKDAVYYYTNDLSFSSGGHAEISWNDLIRVEYARLTFSDELPPGNFAISIHDNATITTQTQLSNATITTNGFGSYAIASGKKISLFTYPSTNPATYKDTGNYIVVITAYGSPTPLKYKTDVPFQNGSATISLSEMIDFSTLP